MSGNALGEVNRLRVALAIETNYFIKKGYIGREGERMWIVKAGKRTKVEGLNQEKMNRSINKFSTYVINNNIAIDKSAEMLRYLVKHTETIDITAIFADLQTYLQAVQENEVPYDIAFTYLKQSAKSSQESESIINAATNLFAKEKDSPAQSYPGWGGTFPTGGSKKR